MIQLGSITPANFKLGSQQVSRIMLGSVEVWSDWTPLDLSPSLWLSDTGSDEATWPDISGNERNATQSTPGNRPSIITNALNGRQVRRFDGTNDHLLMPSGFLPTSDNPRTLILVAKQENSTGAKTLFSYGNDSARQRWSVRYFDAKVQIEVNSVVAETANFTNATDFKIITASHSEGPLTSGASIVINGSPQSLFYTVFSTGNLITADSNRGIGLSIRPTSVFPLNGDIAEILFFSKTLSDNERVLVESYLAAKWGITLP